jgi:hypothetical protein
MRIELRVGRKLTIRLLKTKWRGTYRASTIAALYSFGVKNLPPNLDFLTTIVDVKGKGSSSHWR